MLDFINQILGRNKGFETLSDEDFAKKLREVSKPVIIDVRSRAEFTDEKLHNALNLDVMNPNFKEQIKHYDKDKNYFLYCKSGTRSARACRLMVKEGFENIYNLKGGITAWTGKTV